MASGFARRPAMTVEDLAVLVAACFDTITDRVDAKMLDLESMLLDGRTGVAGRVADVRAEVVDLRRSVDRLDERLARVERRLDGEDTGTWPSGADRRP